MTAEALRSLLRAVLWLLVLLVAARQAEAQSPATYSEGTCPVVLNYDVNLGQGNTSQITVEQWLLEWDFPYSSVIAASSDLFDKSVDLLTPGEPNVALFGDYDRSIYPEGFLQFGFLGTKDNGPTNESNPFNVGPLQNVTFNNLVCTLITAENAPPSGSSPPPPPENGTTIANPQYVQVEYTPIAYINQPLENTFTQFLVRVRNIQNASVIPLEDVSLQYWFHGPEGNLPIVAEYDPGQVFSVRCEWATPGCQNVNLSVIPGDMNVPSARFAVNITMAAGAGALLPSGENAVPSLFLGQGLDVMDLLVTLTTFQGVAILNSTDDFSYMDTPELPVTGNATIVPRRAVVNEDIPAFINGTQVWGTMPPGSVASTNSNASPSMLTSTGIPMAAPSSEMVTDDNLPVGVSCASVQNQTYQSCNLAVQYCCMSVDGEPLKPYPPIFDNVPDGPEGEPADEGDLGPIILPPPRSPPPSPSPPPVSPPPGDNTGQPNGQPDSSSTSGGSSATTIAVAVAVPSAVILLASAGFLYWRSKKKASKAKAAWISSSDVEKGGDVSGSPNGKGGGSGGGDSGSNTKSPHPLAISTTASKSALQQRPLYSSGSGVSGNSTQPLLGTRGEQANLSPFAGATPNGGLQRFNSGLASAADQPVGDYGERFWADIGATNGPGIDFGATRQSSQGWQPLLPRLDSVALGFAATPRASGEGATAFGPVGEADEAIEENEKESEENAKPDISALLERKAQTVQFGSLTVAGLRFKDDFGLHGGDSLSRKKKNTVGVVGNGVGDHPEASGGSSGRSTEEYQDLDRTSMISRSKSWSGELEDLDRLEDGLPVVLKYQYRGQLRGSGSGNMLFPKGSPRSHDASGSSGSGPDLNVDYTTEVAPYLGKCLGTGGFGIVHEATWRGQRVAVKTLPPMGPDASVGTPFHDALQREVALASRFDSDRLVRVLGASTSRPESMCLIMELMEGGNLAQRIYDRHKRRLGYLEILQMAHDVSSGLAYLHPAVVHRDLKPQNILLDKNGRAKLADFGISKVKDPTKSYLSQVTNENGTPIYMAPEQLNSTNINEKVDVYALGVILNECYTRRQPWRDTNNLFQIILRVAINKERPPIDPGCPEPLRWLITKCWQQEPTLRPSCAELVRITELMIQAEVAKWEELHSGVIRRTHLPLNPFI